LQALPVCDTLQLMSTYAPRIAHALSLHEQQVAQVIKLLDDGATIPFIARYRKEASGNLDEVRLLSIRDALLGCKALDARKTAIQHSIGQQDKLTDALQSAIEACSNMTELEDLYLPFKPKRKTRASIAREQGFEPLANLIAQGKDTIVMQEIARLGEGSLQGASDILAERFSEAADLRKALRSIFRNQAIIHASVVKSKKNTPEAAVYEHYFDFTEPVSKTQSHRILAMFRAEKEGFIHISLQPELSRTLETVFSIAMYAFLKQNPQKNCRIYMNEAFEDAYDRLLSASIENELRAELKEKADADAIELFQKNLKHMLLAPALGMKPILAIDPGFRTGAKVVALSKTGELLQHTVMYALEPHCKASEAAQSIRQLIANCKPEAIAIGNGTAGRETKEFIDSLSLSIPAILVQEQGASIYSASPIAREEFPQLDLTIRGAISIGRRLMDPLAELVKIDPQSIGVGQYQHDVDQKKLAQALDETTLSCVNTVGVDLNTASPWILRHVSGIGPKTADAIISYRKSKGTFENRKQLLEIPGFGPKTYELAAGFLRIHNGSEILDSSAVHPESYPAVKRIAELCKVPKQQLIGNAQVLDTLDVTVLYKENWGELTIADVLSELLRPGRDPRPDFQVWEFDTSIRRIEDLQAGMMIRGTVSNVTAFGAFVDLGIHVNGLVHISEMSNTFIKDPLTIVMPGDQITTRVLSVDYAKKRISLSLKT